MSFIELLPNKVPEDIMSFFEFVPNEVLEHIVSFVPESRFPLRQTCALLRNNIPHINRYQFRNQLYEKGSVELILHYKLPCSEENFETILRKGHEELFKVRKNNCTRCIHHSLLSAAVQGRSKYIINYLFTKGYVTRSSLVYEACKQNYLDLVKEMFTEEVEMYKCTCEAVAGEALDVLAWLVEKDETYYNVILQHAMHTHKVQVLRWLPKKILTRVSRKELFLCACDADSMDLFNFLLEANYLPRQRPGVYTRLAASKHVHMLETLVKSKGWVLREEMFETALEEGCHTMLSCLLQLDCPREDLETLYTVSSGSNVLWLIDNLPPTEDILMDLCLGGREAVIIHLIKNGLLPESFDDNPDITLAALEEGFIDAAHEYMQTGYTFYDDVCLRVSNPTSLDWLIENDINLSPELYYRLVRDADLPLLKKLEQHPVDFPADLLDYVFGLISEQARYGRFNTRIIAKLKKIAEWIKGGDV
ncbi:Hypothetical protein BQ3484_572 [Cedratvirus A11]|uniref:Ankyrin repeat-containing domain n=1 Tax=Cedratvirus A11 TaxID=1903266 RepID=A0A1M7XVN8_9VIRU|nr:Hypothetical protein BQ3484_572 [Cedratvirus A11]SHO33640.1 Hypothetical protein BQ3484_572 [Cedratvirus A11]